MGIKSADLEDKFLLQKFQKFQHFDIFRDFNFLNQNKVRTLLKLVVASRT